MTNNLTTTKTKRIEWFDALRGLSMILVIFSHVELFGLMIPISESKINYLFAQLRTPLFYYMSGFMAYKSKNIKDRKLYGQNVMKKIKVLLIPTLFFGLIYAYTRDSSSDLSVWEVVSAFLSEYRKVGYWFTFVLLEMFIVYYTALFFIRKQRKRNQCIILISFALLMFFLSLIYPLNTHTANYFSLELLCRNFQFFIFGSICACYKDRFFKLIDNPYFSGIILLLFAVIYFISLHWAAIFNACHLPHPSMLFDTTLLLVKTAIKSLGALIFVSIFKQYSQFFSSTTRVGRGLQYIGRRTLDIYLIHYFLLPRHIPKIGMYIIKTNSLVIETSIVLLIVLIVILFSIIVSNIIRTSPFLAHYLLGVKWDRGKLHKNIGV